LRLGYNTNGLQNHRLEDALELLAEHGFRAVALTLDVQHLDPYRCTPADVDRIAQRLRALDLVTVIETGARFLIDPRNKHEPTLMSRDPAQRERRLDFYRRSVAIGRDLGARVLSFWSGVDRWPGADSGARLRDGVARTCALARGAGLEPALEPEPGMAVATLADYGALCAALGAQAPALCLDVGHLYATGEAAPADAIGAWAGRLAQVHLEDMRRGVHEHLPPGEGEVDFRAVRSALAAAGYTGTVCFELSRSSHLGPQAMEICRACWESVR
jgi:sugar phosphate isomerase/epimerase